MTLPKHQVIKGLNPWVTTVWGSCMTICLCDTGAPPGRSKTSRLVRRRDVADCRSADQACVGRAGAGRARREKRKLYFSTKHPNEPGSVAQGFLDSTTDRPEAQ